MNGVPTTSCRATYIDVAPSSRAPARWCMALVVIFTIYCTRAAAGEHTIEGGGIFYDLSEGLESTYGEYARGRFETSDTNAWNVDITRLDRFGDTGTQFGASNTHQFSDRVYTYVGVAGSAGGFFWPRVRVDFSASRKWMPEKRLVTTVGGGYFDAKDVHEDVRGFIDASYYLKGPLVLHAGIQVNVSNPGSVSSTSGYLGASYVDNKIRIMSIKGTLGDQAYQAVAANNFIVDFPFHSVRVTWREWLGKTWGLNVAAEHYASDVYDQHGIELGFFKEF